MNKFVSKLNSCQESGSAGKFVYTAQQQEVEIC